VEVRARDKVDGWQVEAQPIGTRMFGLKSVPAPFYAWRLVTAVAVELIANDDTLVVRPVALPVAIILAVSLRRKRYFWGGAGTPALGLCALKDPGPKSDIQSSQGFGFGLALCLIPQTHGVLKTRLEKGEMFLGKQGPSEACEACEEALNTNATDRLRRAVVVQTHKLRRARRP